MVSLTSWVELAPFKMPLQISISKPDNVVNPSIQRPLMVAPLSAQLELLSVWVLQPTQSRIDF